MSEQRSGTPQRFSDEQIVNWLIDECRDTSARLATLSVSGDRILAAGSAVIALAATVAIGGGRSHLLMALPFGVSITVVYGFYLNNLGRILVAYKTALEEEITRRVGLPVIAWSSHVNRGARAVRPIKGLLILGAVVCLASAVIGLGQAIRTLTPGAWGHEVGWLYLALTAASIVIGFGTIGYSLLGVRGHSAVTREVAALLSGTT